ncbi:hypothetical protein AB0K12_25570 [Nonomuraea sp. NPDC049419]|uniref:hypothetical protein n=1 Tax=Nonomuraea sp. NPDC049419 TaxID=3155772 RepID=UPI003440CF28
MSDPTSPLPQIGSREWDQELRNIGVDRREVDAEVNAVPATTDAESEFDPHELLFATDAEAAAVWVMLHQRFPSYGILMYLRMCWSHGDRAVQDWMVRQFAAMLMHGPAPVADSAAYGLWVDYFESPEASQVFTTLTLQLPQSRWDRLLGAAGPVPWDAKHRDSAPDPR